MLYYIHFAADAKVSEPIPPVNQMVSVEADSPQQAIDLLAHSGRVPQSRCAWANVVLSVHPNGVPHWVQTFKLTPTSQIQLDSSPPKGGLGGV